MDLANVSIGLAGSLPHDVIRELAPRIEAAGFRALWLNDTPGGDSLEGLAVAAEVTSALRLATGVIALDRRSPGEITAAAAGLPADRFILGVGSGAAKFDTVAAALPLLREAAYPVYLGALGPRMRRLAAEHSDGVVLNWLTPQAAATAMHDLRDAAASGTVRGVLYSRTIVTESARQALELEAARYASYPAYAANFTRIGAQAIETTIDGSAPGALAERVAEFDVDELVLRAITAEASVDDYLEFIEKIVAA